MDTSDDDAFYLHTNCGEFIRFGAARKGIYSMDTNTDVTFDDIWHRKPESQCHCEPSPVYYDTVDKNKRKYPRRVYRRAVRARQLQNITKQSYRKMYNKVISHLGNCPITKSDAIAMENIFGPNVSNLKGKTVRKMPRHVLDNIDPVPPEILKLHSGVTLCIDIMFVNKVPFFVTLSRNLKFITVESLQRQENKNRIRQVENGHHNV